MKVELNHTIVHCKNKRESAEFVAEILGLPKPFPFFHFLVIQTTNKASLDFFETNEEFTTQHYAFLVGEAEFDAIFERIKDKKITYWADPGKSQKNVINTHFGGRGFYFEEPSGNFLEVITQPYDYA
ncbi:MAG: VOC family protein [Bdellovibrionota bacterium]